MISQIFQTKLCFALFADDTSILYKHRNIHVATSVINDELTIISNWFRVNKLSLNISKTNYMIFHPYQRKVDNVEIYIDKTKVSFSDKIKFLGVYLDSNLSWVNHINNICTKVSKTIGVLYRINSYVPSHIMKVLYDSLIYSQISYCNIVWGNTYPTYLNRIYLLQKKAIRLITNSNYCASTNRLFFHLKTLNIFDVYRYQVSIFMYKYVNESLPIVFDNYFNLNRDYHHYPTRKSDNFHVSRFCTQAFNRSLYVMGPKFWNNLNNDIKNSKSLGIFCRNLKKHILQRYNS
ncbi:hypothetical protein HOLleu_19201 [Holothuria leucospilota]|uniref:Reverse transcriptase domain-containing protein n=1 Tax=Holothuria leucospilota TaxID=206669 RepID=A0A9Q1C2V8_HOLLE|nr:hypothetical protein HOLleu_19201 [Holothuria leucospilota]